MTDRENIKNIVELFIAWNGETEAIDVANLDSAVDFIADSLQEEPKLLTGKTKLEKIMAVADNMPRATLALSPTDNAVSRDWERRMVDAAESLGISQEKYEKIVDECVFGKEEPVNEDLEEAAENAIEDLEQKLTNVTLDEVVRNWLRCMFRAGAKWQKEVFEKNRLAACDRATKEEIEREQDFVDKVLIGEQRQPTFSDAIEYGIKWQKQQTIDKACEFFIEHCSYIDTASYDLDDVINNFRKALEED